MSEMSKGNTWAALRSLSKENKGSLLHLADSVPAVNGEYTSVLDILRSKHLSLFYNGEIAPQPAPLQERVSNCWALLKGCRT